MIRIASATLLASILITMAALSNSIWQNVYCGTPLCKTDPFSLIPCEPEDKVLAEWREWERRAIEYSQLYKE